MANTGTRKTVKLGDFGAFEGDKVTAAQLKFEGTKPADRKYLEGSGETQFFLVETECRKIEFARNVDGDMIRRHSMRLVEVTEVPEALRDQVIDVLRETADRRKGAQALDFDGEDEPDA